jgi:hypothetical protein
VVLRYSCLEPPSDMMARFWYLGCGGWGWIVWEVADAAGACIFEQRSTCLAAPHPSTPAAR